MNTAHKEDAMTLSARSLLGQKPDAIRKFLDTLLKDCPEARAG